MIKLSLVTTIIIFMLCDSKCQKNGWKFDHIDKQTIIFKNRKKFETNLFDLHYIGQLETKRKIPYLILSGQQCDKCDANTSIYIHSPSDGKMKNEAFQNRYLYPGKIEDYITNKLLVESRMFYCHSQNNDGDYVIWFNKFHINEKPREEIYIVKVIDDNIKEVRLENYSIDTISNYEEKCKEIEGKTFSSEP